METPFTLANGWYVTPRLVALPAASGCERRCFREVCSVARLHCCNRADAHPPVKQQRSDLLLQRLSSGLLTLSGVLAGVLAVSAVLNVLIPVGGIAPIS